MAPSQVVFVFVLAALPASLSAEALGEGLRLKSGAKSGAKKSLEDSLLSLPKIVEKIVEKGTGLEDSLMSPPRKADSITRDLGLVELKKSSSLLSSKAKTNKIEAGVARQPKKADNITRDLGLVELKKNSSLLSSKAKTNKTEPGAFDSSLESEDDTMEGDDTLGGEDSIDDFDSSLESEDDTMEGDDYLDGDDFSDDTMDGTLDNSTEAGFASQQADEDEDIVNAEESEAAADEIDAEEPSLLSVGMRARKEARQPADDLEDLADEDLLEDSDVDETEALASRVDDEELEDIVTSDEDGDVVGEDALADSLLSLRAKTSSTEAGVARQPEDGDSDAEEYSDASEDDIAMMIDADGDINSVDSGDDPEVSGALATVDLNSDFNSDDSGADLVTYDDIDFDSDDISEDSLSSLKAKTNSTKAQDQGKGDGGADVAAVDSHGRNVTKQALEKQSGKSKVRGDTDKSDAHGEDVKMTPIPKTKTDLKSAGTPAASDDDIDLSEDAFEDP